MQPVAFDVPASNNVFATRFEEIIVPDLQSGTKDNLTNPTVPHDIAIMRRIFAVLGVQATLDKNAKIDYTLKGELQN